MEVTKTFKSKNTVLAEASGAPRPAISPGLVKAANYRETEDAKDNATSSTGF